MENKCVKFTLTIIFTLDLKMTNSDQKLCEALECKNEDKLHNQAKYIKWRNHHQYSLLIRLASLSISVFTFISR